MSLSSMAGSLKTTLPRAHDPFPGSDASEGWHMIQRRGFRRGRGVASAWEAGQLGLRVWTSGAGRSPRGYSGRPVP